jgi:hypothetical protein
LAERRAATVNEVYGAKFGRLYANRSEVEVQADCCDYDAAASVPRLGITWVIFAIAIFAINFTVMRARLEYPNPLGEDLLFRALRMANVLVVGLLIAQQRPRNRPFLLRFKFFGAIALASYIALARLFPGPRGPVRS